MSHAAVDSKPAAALSASGFSLVLAVLVGVAYPDVLFGSQTLFFRDFGFFGYPLAYFHRQSFWNGEIPLWNPFNCCGLPFLAQWNTMVLYPGSLVYLILPLPWSLNLFCFGHLFFAGLAMYWLADRWGASGLAAAVAGVAFALNGLSLNALMWPNNIAALAWLPLVVLHVEKAWQTGGRQIIAAGIVGAVQMLTGAPEIVIFTWVILGLLLATEIAVQIKSVKSYLPRFLCVVLLVAGFSAIQLLPFLDLLAHSHREENFASSDWPMPVSGWANFLVPLFRTYREPPGVYFQFNQYWTTSYYAGISILALAILAVGCLRSRRVWLLGAIVVLGIVLALGDKGDLHPWVQRLFPPLRAMRFPIKFVVLTMFGLPLLAAFAVDHLSRSFGNDRSVWRHTMILLAVLLIMIQGIVWYGTRYPVPGENWPAIFSNGLTRSAFLCAAFGILFVICRFQKKQRVHWMAVGLILLLAGDALTHVPRQNPTVDRGVLEPNLLTFKELHPSPRHGQSRAMASPEAEVRLHFLSISDPKNNYLIKRLGLVSNCNLLESVPSISGFFSLYLREANHLRFVIAGMTNREVNPLFDFLSISQITRTGTDFEWQARPTYLPMVTAGQRPVFAEDREIMQAIASQDFDPRTTVYLPSDAEGMVRAKAEATAVIDGSQFEANRAGIRVRFESAGFLVIAQSYHRAWRAVVDGRPARILQANYAFQAVEVPAGSHLVQLQYRDPMFLLGMLVSVACGLGSALCCLARSRTSGRASLRRPGGWPEGATDGPRPSNTPARAGNGGPRTIERIPCQRPAKKARGNEKKGLRKASSLWRLNPA